MTAPEEVWTPPEGVCVCGRDLPKESPSDWACSEPCQSAWLHHQADPGYPHPREIREQAEARAAGRMGTGVAAPAVPAGAAGARYARGGLIPPGTEIDVDGRPFVRVGAHWQPAGMWTPLRSELADAVAYQRWCPRCRRRHVPVDVSGPPGSDLERAQVCPSCDHAWQGPPLVGMVETRGEPWPSIRMRLTDGNRSTTVTFSEQEIETAGGEMAERMRRCWIRMERRLGGGFADADEPSDQQVQRAARRRSWRDWVARA